MSPFAKDIEEKATRPRVQVHLEQGDAAWTDLSFTEPFSIGRGAQCEVQIDSGLVSRVHAEVVFEDGAWWVRDLGSTNGVFVDGEKTERATLEGEVTVQLGRNAPILRLSVEPGVPFEETVDRIPAVPPAERASSRRAGRHPGKTVRSAPTSPRTKQNDVPPVPPFVPSPPVARSDPPPSVPPSALPPSAPPSALPPSAPVVRSEPPPSAAPLSRPSEPPSPPPSTPPSASPGQSLEQIRKHYFEADSARPAGDRTMMIRQAYSHVKQKQQRKYTGVILAVLAVTVIVLGFAVFQTIRNQRLEAQASELFAQVKQQDLETAQLRYALLGSEDADLRAHLEQLEARRRRQAAAYDGFVRELGIYRQLSDEEELIYRTARIFNESDVTIPAGFVREVRNEIRTYWQSPVGRSRFAQAVERAERNGYTELIVQTMQKYGLPPEFFYLSMQESDFNPNVFGSWTRWGIAKGMWQFIPSTGQQYGLRIGPRADTRVMDPQDERHDVAKATDAAARYLLYIYSTPAQASGLLVMASYNWGEHRVIRKLQDLGSSQEAIEAAFEGIAENPDERNYWRFLETYEERMPDQTKDYVLKIFSAAVISQNPRFFGFDFDNPLKPYMERSTTQAE